jgi:serine/threonine-protein kinase
MQLLCPHCHNPIEAVALDLAHETLCPSCGSTFRLDKGSTVTWPPSEGPGTQGPYELVGMVGTGELGSVYKAHDPELDRPVAIKMPHAGILVSDEDRKRFLREARTAPGLLLREIKPSNILLDEQGKPQQPVL